MCVVCKFVDWELSLTTSWAFPSKWIIFDPSSSKERGNLVMLFSISYSHFALVPSCLGRVEHMRINWYKRSTTKSSLSYGWSRRKDGRTHVLACQWHASVDCLNGCVDGRASKTPHSLRSPTHHEELHHENGEPRKKRQVIKTPFQAKRCALKRE